METMSASQSMAITAIPKNDFPYSHSRRNCTQGQLRSVSRSLTCRSTKSACHGFPKNQGLNHRVEFTIQFRWRKLKSTAAWISTWAQFPKLGPLRCSMYLLLTAINTTMCSTIHITSQKHPRTHGYFQSKYLFGDLCSPLWVDPWSYHFEISKADIKGLQKVHSVLKYGRKICFNSGQRMCANTFVSLPSLQPQTVQNNVNENPRD